ncbi:hypothetical protein E2C01_098352 [Portunus trituberculatus]|uniref:Uncharacterized protein n=1 Tax=Portunus trituberculatus TaxID=210409 RepID=A0A5B7K6T6_PORTR|nr:hypothetical protein [Portunus trituberculatus]
MPLQPCHPDESRMPLPISSLTGGTPRVLPSQVALLLLSFTAYLRLLSSPTNTSTHTSPYTLPASSTRVSGKVTIRGRCLSCDPVVTYDALPHPTRPHAAPLRPTPPLLSRLPLQMKGMG